MSTEEFKLGQQVLVRLSDHDDWSFDFFSHYEVGADAPYVCTGNCNYEQCVPLNDDTKNLVGTDNPFVKQVPESEMFECGQWVEVEYKDGTKCQALYLRYKPRGSGANHQVFVPSDPEAVYWWSYLKIHKIEE